MMRGMPSAARSGQSIRVAVDGLGLSRDSAYRGIGTYCRHVLAALAEDPDLDIVALVPGAAEVPAGIRRRRTFRIAPGRWAAAEHDWLTPIELSLARPDVVFSPGRFPPRRSPRPVVQTLHDVVPLLPDTDVLEEERDVWRRSLPRWPQAAVVVAVSEDSARSARKVGVPADRIVVAPHGVDPAFVPAARFTRAEPPYLLMVGEYDPRKRHHLAFEVVAGLASRGQPHGLKVAGRLSPVHADAFASLVAQAPRPDLVSLLGYRPLAELVTLYQQADAVIVTSSHEGFGFPALEAMACGTPVVAFDNSATSEVVGGAGILVPDGDVHAMVDAVEAIVTSPAHRADLAARCLSRAGKYSWRASAAIHAAALRTAAAGRKRP
jgi:glycosyltransferase involved in cell wall biosynthesis